MDFVAEKPNEKLYLQMAESMSTDEVRKRELRPLNLIQDNYEKIVLSMDKSYITSYEGIKAINLIDWLLAESHCPKRMGSMRQCPYLKREYMASGPHKGGIACIRFFK